MWQTIGIIVSPLKHAVFWLVSRVHKTTRPRVAIIYGDEVLVVRNWGDRKWSLPGGGAHRGEEPKRAAVRECKEELGVEIPPEELEFVMILEQKTYFAPVYSWKPDKKPLITAQKMEITGVKWYSKHTILNNPTEVSETVSTLIF